jgi:hypothetical protein
MTKTEYRAYLQSDHWRAFRLRSIEAWPNCVNCEMPRWLAVIAYDQDLHVHHKNYRSRGRETLADVDNLCRRCHDIESFGRSDLREPKSATCQSCEAKHWNPYCDLCAECGLLNGLGSGPWLGSFLELPQFSAPERGRALWKGILRSICNLLACHPSDTECAEVTAELGAIRKEFAENNAKWLAECSGRNNQDGAEVPF